MRGRCLISSAIVVALAACGTPSSAPHVAWPRFGPTRPGVVIAGHTNTVPDLVGPVDGSARLTIITEGNHFPVLLPLVFEGFPAWNETQPGCRIEANEILVITLPQAMVVRALREGSLQLGNLVLPFESDRVYPDIVMGGEEALRTLARAGIVEPQAFVIARHRGMGLLVRRDRADTLATLDRLIASDASVVLATPDEPGARRQYVDTLVALAGDRAADRLLTREVETFSGRLGIQHRDVPYAILTGVADAGLIFRHLAQFYAEREPERLAFVPIAGAEAFGNEIAMSRSTHAATDPAVACFERFLLANAPAAYGAAGFVAPPALEVGRRIELRTAPRSGD